MLPLLIASVASIKSLAALTEGCLLAASVYLTSRGVRNPLKNRKKR